MNYIKTAEELNKHLTEDFYESPQISVDTETTGLDPMTAKLRLLQLSNNKNTIVIDMFETPHGAVIEKLRPILETDKQVKILQNAKFDLKFIKYHLGTDIERVFDTMLASQIIEGGIQKPRGYHGLEQIAERYGDQNINKDEQKSNWGGELSEKQLSYAATDVECLFRIRDEQIKVLQDLKLIRCAKLEFDAILPTAWLELCGFYLDYNQWMEVANANLVKVYDVASKMNKLLEPYIDQQTLFEIESINFGSHAQVRKYFKMAGIELPESTKDFFLAPLAKKYELVQLLQEYRKYSKSHSSFGEGFQKFINPFTGRIHADFKQLGTETGRYATSNPNLGQIPADSDHRNCFKASEGYTLFTADFSQEELRMIADQAHDKKMIAAFNSGADFHTNTASMLWNIPVDKVPDYERGLAKRANFGLTYGAGAPKFAGLADISIAEAEIIRQKYFNTFSGMKNWIMYQKQKVLQTRCARTPSGRLIKYEFDDTDMKSVGMAQRCAVNGPIQGGGSDILKRSLRLLYDSVKHYGDAVKLVNVVHDQLDMEIREDIIDEVKDVVLKAMTDAGSEFIKDVPVKVDYKISRVWKK